MTKVHTARGFTIVELLIVIVVVAILAAITIVAYNGIQQRAYAVSIVSTLKSIDKGLNIVGVDQGWSQWPDGDDILPGYPDPTVTRLISDTSLKKYLQTVPKIRGIPANNWSYDNDGDIKPTTCGSVWNGVNIEIETVDASLATSVDKSIDDGDLNCGRLRYDTHDQTMLYSLSYDQSVI